MPPPDTGWRIAGRRGRSTADPAAPDADADDATHHTAPTPHRRPLRGPRPHAAVVADAVAAVRSLAPSVAASPAWRRLVARLDEAEEDADEGSEEEGAGRRGGQGRWAPARVAHIIVLGLGAVAAPGPPRAQAALACLLASHVARQRREGGPPPAVTAADPAFSTADADVLTALGWAVATPNDAVASVAAALADGDDGDGACVLAYTPHCDPPVVEALLAAAWTPAALPRLALVGNSLLALRDKWGAGGRADGGAARRPARCLALADAAASRRGAVVEACVAGPAPAAGDPHGAAFNDTAVVVVGAWEAGWGI